MRPTLRSLCLLALLPLGNMPAQGTAAPRAWYFERLALRDGRVLSDAWVRSYDEKTGKVFVLSEGLATVVPAVQLPEPWDERATEHLPSSGAYPSKTKAKAEAESAETANRPDPAEPPPSRPASKEDQRISEHREKARREAERQFRYRQPLGSSQVAVTQMDIDTSRPEKILGWPGRFRTTGTAFVEFYDSVGRSFSRATRKFEVITEVNRDYGEIEVIDFRRP